MSTPIRREDDEDSRKNKWILMIGEFQTIRKALGVAGAARFSRCRRYRYLLTREWNEGKTVLFIGLNPSTADAHADDPTVRRCVRFAVAWGFGRLLLANLFAYRLTDSSALARVARPIGPCTDRILKQAVGRAHLVVAAWGVRGRLLGRDRQVLQWLNRPHCLGVTKQGYPRHPLYLPKSCSPQPFVSHG